ncbi:aldose 1-epimerase family protein [Flavobacterium okayamense]|uniref:LACX protein n=1 Tax=Flavobacterium okayamense TaxID=2830782 RepID=A0ABN6HYQ6_9FLAO|nr:aldose 1-epimerase family protein [Flavobacterium okayamense]BCY29475.1 LACX protein [Flavobacterium okayamense]
MIYTISNNNTSAEINTKGAELIRLTKGNQNYIWDIDEQFWNKTSPILFPIVGRLKNDEYRIEKESYNLPRHGFARDFEFEVVEKSDSKIVLELVSNHTTLINYPFEFRLRLSYELIENNIVLTYETKNFSNNKMPYSIGAHPAFKIENIEEYSLSFPNDNELTFYSLENELYNTKTNKISLENNKLALHYNHFRTDALVLKKFNSNEFSLLKAEKPYITFRLTNFPHLGIWTKNNAPFICIEPWNGFADYNDSNGNIFDKRGITILEPEELATNKIEITMH